jgi:hypothetical protein
VVPIIDDEAIHQSSTASAGVVTIATDSATSATRIV